MKPLSRTETAIIHGAINAEAMEVATEHCAYLARQGITPADALHLIGRSPRHGWGTAISAYAARWKAMQRRRVLTEGLT